MAGSKRLCLRKDFAAGHGAPPQGTIKKNTHMEQVEREVHNQLTALQGERPHRVGSKAMRRVSLESVSVLQLVGSPFAPVFNAALNGEKVGEAPTATAVDIAVFAWAHSAPADEVLHTALTCAPGYAAPAVDAALRYIRDWSMEEVGAVVQFAMRDAVATSAANFDMAAPDYGGGDSKKNG